MKIRFQPRTEFAAALRARVDAYLASSDAGSIRRRMLLKTAIILTWFVASYVGLVLFASSIPEAVALTISLALSIAGVGFAIEHDANHEAYPVGPRFRRLLGWTLDIAGASSYVWRYKHNANHHHYTNVAGADSDIDIQPFARISPSQRRRWWHQVQHLYMWPLYGVLPLKWLLYDDWRDIAVGRIGENPFPRPRGREVVYLVAGKLVTVTLWFVVPLVLHPPLVVLGLVALGSLVLGVTEAAVFQLAHAVEKTAFPTPAGEPPTVAQEFVAHQLTTTSDFARGSTLLTWFLGGLNYQVEHHLFPRQCHLHYPALARIVEATCTEYGMPYLAYSTMGSAVASHFRLLRKMGRPAPT